ncbi:hypothetical protein J4475_01235 [Candidatus Woesearchaeota archaeon]|nr:hypothetical protein [Candidatus Woesearchaeota archaeon]
MADLQHETFTERGYFPEIPSTAVLGYDGSWIQIDRGQWLQHKLSGPSPDFMVVKVSTNVLAHSQKRHQLYVFRALSADISDIISRRNIPVAIVTSGAIGLGHKARENYRYRNQSIYPDSDDTNQQRSIDSIIGQPLLTAHWESALHEFGLAAEERLLVHADLMDKRKRKGTLDSLCKSIDAGKILLVNEDDARSYEELEIDPETQSFGDNDRLSALLAIGISQHHGFRHPLLVNLTSVNGLYTPQGFYEGNPNQLIRLVRDTTGLEDDFRAQLAELQARPDYKPPRTGRGIGGEMSKLSASIQAANSGIDVVVCNGEVALHDRPVVEGEEQFDFRRFRPLQAVIYKLLVGTRFEARLLKD